MSFGWRQLQSMGWTEGSGLGVNQNGIKTAIKPKLKFDKNGIGFESTETSNQWWNQSFNCSANYIDFKITQTQSGVKIKSKDRQNKRQKPKKYSNFVKSSEIEAKNQEINKSEENEEFSEKITKTLDFEEVFRKSDGRTGHKGGRHGIKMSGKLKRIEEQNNEFINKYKKLKSNN